MSASTTNEYLDQEFRTSKGAVYRHLTSAQKEIGRLLAQLTSDDPDEPGNDPSAVSSTMYEIMMDIEDAVSHANNWTVLAAVPRA